MESIPLLKDMIVLLGISVPISIILMRIGLPTIVGFLLTGIIIGPFGFGLVAEVHKIEVLAEIGVVLLLFTIGLEFKVSRMLKIKREAMLGGGLQLALTGLLVLGLTTYMGLGFNLALTLAFIVSLSSSVIVLKLLGDKGLLKSAHGNLSVGILLFQDICVVIMVMVVQGFSEGAGINGLALLKELGIAMAVVLAIVVSSAYIVPRLFHQIVKLRNREVFILAVVLLCMGTAWLTSLVGLSLAIGAFIAGLVVSESEYSHQIVAEVLPFRDIFSSLFFVSIGMLLDVNFFMNNTAAIALIVLAVILLKSSVVILVAQIIRYPLRMAIIVGLTLAQIGEFSFILMKIGEKSGVIPDNIYQLVLASTVVTMALTPFLMQVAVPLAAFVGRVLGIRAVKGGKGPKARLKDHVIIVGYGLNGRNLANVLKETGIAHLVLDVNYERIKNARKSGHTAYYGEAGHPEILKMLGVEDAKMLVLGISDSVATRKAVKAAKDINPQICIIVRTRYIDDLEELYKLGATQVIPEEFETSVEIFARVLKEYRIPGNIIQNQIDLVRHEGYAMFRGQSLDIDRLAHLERILETSVMDTFFVEEDSAIAGKTLAELDIRRKTGGATVMALIRKGSARTNPRGDVVVEAGDMMVILGSHMDLNKAMKILKAEAAPHAGSKSSAEGQSPVEDEGGVEDENT
ncbi:Inner membrane protein, KefB/KefC family [hydrothermal vent metagenome]|uniref:Inner membrane protein, KefB/KefC family n=1 Tax=hydrothermal vent metagenome TaxID=652676 RepID=A0A3B0VJ31_9ZZZZ